LIQKNETKHAFILCILLEIEGENGWYYLVIIILNPLLPFIQKGKMLPPREYYALLRIHISVFWS